MSDAANGVSDVAAANGRSPLSAEDKNKANEERLKANEHFKSGRIQTAANAQQSARCLLLRKAAMVLLQQSNMLANRILHE